MNTPAIRASGRRRAAQHLRASRARRNDGGALLRLRRRDHRAVHNANLLVAQHLLEVAVRTDDEAMARLALRAVQFTLNAQRSDGAFPTAPCFQARPATPR